MFRHISRSNIPKLIMQRTFIPWTIAWLTAILWPLHASYAQSCDCEGSTNCPQTIQPDTSYQLCYDITDAFNDDLADPAQGVCGVRLTFTHQHIWDLEISLVSPNGDTLLLIGPEIPYFGTTNSVLWDITFVPCSATAVPDTVNGTPLATTWTNNQNWPFAGIIAGSYYPVGNSCLESFNAGPVNGSWCLLIDNTPSFYPGTILNFEILLCDNSGLICCEADGGSLAPYPDWYACEGDSTLLLDIPPVYYAVAPDTLEYGYQYLVTDTAGLIIDLDSLPNLIPYPAGIYTVCGLSYRLTEADSLGLITTGMPLDTLQAWLNGPSPPFCGDLSSSCLQVVISNPPPVTVLSETICQGDSLQLADSLFFTPGNYSLLFQASTGCDSLVELQLDVLPHDTTALSFSLCPGDTLFVADSLFAEAGHHTLLLQNQNGCDSLLRIDLTYFPVDTIYLFDTICQGDVYPIGDSLFSLSGNYILHFSDTQTLCDSVVVLDLTVLDLQVQIAAADTLTCNMPEITLDGSNSSAGTGISYNWTSTSGEFSSPVTEPVVQVTAPGIYVLQLQQAACTASDSINVVAMLDVPQANAGPPDTLTCEQMQLTLDGSASQTGQALVYLWLSPNGNILQGADGLQPQVDAPGLYILTLTDTLSGCVGSDSVWIAIDTLLPVADAGPDQLLTCATDVVVLDGSASYLPQGHSYSWTDEQGNELPWSGALQLEVSDSGYYYLTVIDLTNGCTAVDSVLVSSQMQLPQVEAGPSESLTCAETTISLMGQGSSVNAVSYWWSTLSGNFVSAVDQAFVQVDAPAWYYLTVTDSVTLCAAVDSVFIGIDTLSPMAEAGFPITLNCDVTTWMLGEASGTSQGPDFTYTWTNAEGEILGEELHLTIDTGGLYVLSVLNNGNGCVVSDTTIIYQNQEYPVADAGLPDSLTCEHPQALLDGSASTQNPFMTYAWYNSAGQLVGMDLQVGVGQADTYCLVAVNGLNFCADTACVEIVADEALPIVTAGSDQAVSCDAGQALLSAEGSSSGPLYESFWTGPSASFLTDSTQLEVVVQETGFYVFTVVNTLTSCQAYDTVMVYLDTAACTPQVFAGADGLLNCYQPLYDTLDATATVMEPFWTLHWTALAGSIISGENSLTPVVTAGVYVLEVANPVVGLSAYDTVQVLTDFAAPVADAGDDLLLNCSDVQQPIVLDGSGSSQNGPYLYTWSTLGGNLLSGANTLMPLVNAFGIYDLTVTDTLNGCSATDAMSLSLFGEIPAVCLPDVLQIDCHDTTIAVVDTCAVASGLVYSWTVAGGQILGPSDVAGITAYVPAGTGVFYLEVVDTTNACVAYDSVQILAPSPCPPDCVASAAGVFTCQTDSVLLSGLGSSEGPGLLYAWEAVSGNLCAASDSIYACASSPGIYQLTVMDTGSGLSCVVQVEVPADTVAPVLLMPENAFLDCSNEPVLLQASVPGDTSNLIFQWTTSVPVNCMVSGAQSAAVSVVCEGTYVLTVTNQSNGCLASDSIVVNYDTLAPWVVLNEPSPLTCLDSTSFLSGAGSDFGPDLLWQWYHEGELLPWLTGISSWSPQEPGTYCLEIVNEQNHCRDSVCAEVLLQLDTPVVSFAGDLVLNCSDTSLALVPEQAFDAALQYQWYTQDGCFLSDPVAYEVQIACSGIYFLEVFDPQTACSATASLMVVDQSVNLHAEAGEPDTLTCLVEQLSLDGSASDMGPSIVYSWLSPNGNILSGANGLMPVVDAPAWYYLQLQDTLTGCTAVDSVQIFIDTFPPFVDAGPDKVLNCMFSSVQLEGNLDGTSFSWYGASGQSVAADSLQPLVEEGGWYVLLVQNEANGCVADDSVFVTLDTVAPVAEVLASHQLLNCTVPQVILDGSSSQPVNGGGLHFSWTTQDGHFVYGQNQQIAAVDAAGWYVLEVADVVNACTDTAAVYVGEDFDAPEVAIASPGQITCAQPEVLLEGSVLPSGNEFVYQWSSLPPDLPIAGDTTLSAVVFQAGTYVLEVLDVSNGCSTTASVLVTENLLLPQAVAEAIGEIDCVSPYAGLSGEAGSSQGVQYTYFWYPLPGTQGEVVFGESQLMAEVNGPGFYVLEVTDQTNGCVAADTVEVVASQLPISTASVLLTSPLCPGFDDAVIVVDSVLGGTPPYLYALNGEALGPYPVFNQLSAGTYVLQIEDLNGCMWDTVLQVTDPPYVGVVLTGDTLVDLGEWVQITGLLSGPVDTLWWEPLPPVACDQCTSFAYLPENNAVYTLTVADSNGCIASDAMAVYVRRSGKVYVPNAFSPNGDGVNDVFYLQAGPGVEEVELLQVYDRWGEMLFEARYFPPNNPHYGWNGRLGGHSMNPGLYVWQASVRLLDGRVVWLKGEVMLVR